MKHEVFKKHRPNDFFFVLRLNNNYKKLDKFLLSYN